MLTSLLRDKLFKTKKFMNLMNSKRKFSCNSQVVHCLRIKSWSGEAGVTFLSSETLVSVDDTESIVASNSFFFKTSDLSGIGVC